MQSEMADFALVLPPDELDEAYVLSLTLAHSLHYVKTRRHPQNQKYIKYYTAIRRGHVTGNMYKQTGDMWTCSFRDKRADR